MKQVEVTILGQSYLLACPEGGEARLAAAVASVDREMSAIRDAGKVRARERIAVLAALNLAYQASERSAANRDEARSEPVATHGSGDSHGLPPPEEASRLAELISRLDGALRADGHLL